MITKFRAGIVAALIASALAPRAIANKVTEAQLAKVEKAACSDKLGSELMLALAYVQPEKNLGYEARLIHAARRAIERCGADQPTVGHAVSVAASLAPRHCDEIPFFLAEATKRNLVWKASLENSALGCRDAVTPSRATELEAQLRAAHCPNMPVAMLEEHIAVAARRKGLERDRYLQGVIELCGRLSRGERIKQ